MGYRRPFFSELLDVDDKLKSDQFILRWNSESQSHIYSELTVETLGAAPAEHSHEIVDISGLSETLEGLNEELSEKCSIGHTHTINEVSLLSSTLGVKADLVDGKIPTSQLPAVAISEFLGRAADESEMILLEGQRGDYCYREDLQAAFWLTTDDPSDKDNWLQVALPSVSVQSVNDQTGTVVLGYADVGAAGASHTHTIADTTGLQDALDGKAAASHTHTISNVTGLQAAIDGKAGLASANTFTENQTINANLLAIIGAADPTLRLSEGGSSTSYTSITDVSTNVLRLDKVSSSGDALMLVNPIPANNTSQGYLGLFRNTLTSGLVSLILYRGNNTGDINTIMGANGNSYLNALVGNLAVGHASPQAKFHSVGSTILGAATTAVADGNMGNGQLNFWLDESGSSLKVKVKRSDGVIKTVTIPFDT